MVLRKWISILGLAPKAGEEATANRFTKFHKFLKRLDEIGYFSTNSTERSHEIS
jgi:NADH/NAD ratio-sensing transcriptional regulator Rex